jgi:thioesterase domain-containing protein/acyl carrier protein
MVPAGLELVESWPLTANGKLDRSRLRPSTATTKPEFRPPEGELQAALCAIFTDVLQADRVGIDSNFFDLGGHSLLATRLISRIREQLRAQLSIRDIFECPTVLQLTGLIETGRPSPAGPDVLLPLRATGSRAPLFCIHPAIGLSWVYTPLPRLLDPEQPVFGLQSPGLYPGERLPSSLTELAATYVAAIRRRQPSGPYQLLGWSYGAGVAHEITAQLEQRGEKVSLLVMLDGYPPNSAPHPVLAATDSENLGMLLGSVGQPAPAGPLDLAGYRELARTPGNPLAGLDDDLLEVLPAVFAYHLNLLSEFRPSPIRADVLYFDALADKDDQSPSPTEWLPYLTGRFDVVPLDCGHAEVLAPQPLARIAAMLRPLLDPARTSDRPLVPFPTSPYRRPQPKIRKSS